MIIQIPDGPVFGGSLYLVIRYLMYNTATEFSPLHRNVNIVLSKKNENLNEREMIARV
jgi:hypothetical protein